jgi:hypothetical protein
VRNSSTFILVEARLGIKRIYEMDEANHRVTLYAILLKRWHDEFLRWDPGQFEGIEHTYVDYASVWSPRLQLISKYVNEASRPTDFSVDDVYDNFPVRVNYNGSMEFAPSLHLSSECLFNYERFPFDLQICSFIVCFTKKRHGEKRTKIREKRTKNEKKTIFVRFLLPILTKVTKFCENRTKKT